MCGAGRWQVGAWRGVTVHEFRTASGVRLRPVAQRPGDLNWLLLPGGPGIGSQSLQGLAEATAVPCVTWLVDLPDAEATGRRIEFFARCAALEDLAYGRTHGRAEYTRAAERSLGWLFPS